LSTPLRSLRRSAERPRASHQVLLFALVLLAGCARRGGGQAVLSGHVPANSATVGAIALPEVHAGRGSAPFRLQPAAGRLLIVYFGYTTCPDVCPTTLADLHRALEHLGDEARRIEVAFVTVDPARDTPDLLAPYLAAFVTAGHPLRPAGETDLAQAEHAFGAISSVTRDAEGEIEVSHSGTMYVVDEAGKIADEWSFGTSAEAMAHDLRILLARRGG